MSKEIEGKAWALKHEEALVAKIKTLHKQPVLVSFLVGDDPGSLLYTNIKKRKAQELGIDFRVEKYPVEASFKEVAQRMQELNTEVEVDGIMVQLPSLPGLVELIVPHKDVDGLLPNSPYQAATVRGIMSLITDEKIDLLDKVVVIVGAKGEVGSRLVIALQGKARQLIGVDKEIEDISLVTKRADVIISSTGKHYLIKPEMIKDGVILFDVGSEKLETGEVVGDVDPNSYAKASMVTPVPGGVGPMTVISLMENVVESVTR